MLCTQPPSITSMSGARRWLIFLVGIFETMVWSGTIFGWASLVHVLKTRGVYSHLCAESLKDVANATEDVLLMVEESRTSCVKQDQQFALVYTVTCVVYSIPGVLIGYCLHHLGLAFTRIIGGCLMSAGFILLSLTSADTPSYLWGAAVVLSVGGNVVRMSGLQLGNLFPARRNTAMAVISGMFTPSAGIFIILQYALEGGVSWVYTCWAFAAVASLILAATPFMPRHHVPYTEEPEEPKDKETIEAHKESSSTAAKPVMGSYLSWSNLLHSYWIFSNLCTVTLFSTYFNMWVNTFSETTEEAARYSRLYGFANVLCFFVSPLPGLLVDAIATRFKRGKEGLAKQIASVQASIVPMILVTGVVMAQLSSLLFKGPVAVYIGLVCLVINRPSCLAVGNPLLRNRFPADHFNRIVGVQGTVVALLTLLQYPHFTWAQYNYNAAMGFVLGALLLNLAHPLHLCSKTYLRRVMAPLPLPDPHRV